MSTVSLKKISTYDPDKMLDALRACLEPLGGMRAFVRTGQRVLLKPNLLGAFDSDRAVTTHPSLVRAAALLVKEAGGKVVVGDSPGMSDLPGAMKKSGLTDALADLDVEVGDFVGQEEFTEPGNVVAKKIHLAAALKSADVVITLPKMKSHVQMVFTGALKNQYGLITGNRKAHYHYRMKTREWLSSLIVDINRIANPALAIMDAVMAMEGEGPSSGEPRLVGALLAGPDLTAVDVAACRLIGLRPETVPLIQAARQQGFGVTEWKNIRMVGDSLDDLCVTDFKLVKELDDLLKVIPLPMPLLNWLGRKWAPTPEIIAEQCIRCGICKKGCPVSPSAIDPFLDRREKVDGKRCIRCYCCHEFCPVKAIRLRRNLFHRLLNT